MALDLETLLTKVSEDAPSGPDPRADYSPQSFYFQLRDARSDARAAERAADTDPAAEADALGHWRRVADLAQKALVGSRDLEIAAWLTEALVREEGLSGLAQGAALLEGLARNFWDDLHPMPDEDGMETRVAAVAGLNGLGGDGTLIQPLRKLSVFEQTDGTPVPLFMFQQAEEVAAIGDENRKAARLEAGAPDLDALETEARAAGGAHFASLLAEAEAALSAWQSMGAAFDSMAGADSPPTSRVAEVVGQIAALARRFAPAASADGDMATAPMADAADGSAAPSGATVVAAAAPGQIVTREDALRQLGEIAAFFRRSEPQSPISLTIDEAIRRARLSWAELLAEIQPDEATRQAMLTALGIKPEE